MNSYEAKLAARRERLEAKAERLNAEASARYNQASERAAMIPFGQPILVGHYSEGRDRNFRAKIRNGFGKAFALQKEAGEAAAKAASVGSGGISSDDPEAIQKLKQELAQMEELQARMKAANVVIRKGGGVAGLMELGFSEKVAARLLEKDFAGRIGFAGYQLTNNSANARRVKARIAELEAKAGAQSKEEELESGVRVVENVEENRLQIFFPGKPEAAMIAKLKSSGFRWAPSVGAWQRHLGNNARWAAKYILGEA